MDASTTLLALQGSAASVLAGYLPDRRIDNLGNNLWTPVGRNTSLKYAWVVRKHYLAPFFEGRLGTLRSTTLFAASTLWHLQLVFGDGPSGCGADPSAPVRLQLAPTLGSLLWHEEDAVTLEGRLELPGAPEGAGWRRHAFVARVTKHSPASLPGLTCGRLRQAMSGDTLYVNAYIDDVTMHWHADSRHVEAQLFRGAQQYFTTTALASRLGVFPRLEALNASHTVIRVAGAAHISVTYRLGSESSEDQFQVLRRLLYDNVACHVRGDGGAAAHKFCELQRSALWPQQAGLGSGELLRLLSPCQDKRAAGGARSPSWSSPPPQPPPAGPSGPLAAASFNAGPVCDGLDGSTEFDSVVRALLKAKDGALAARDAAGLAPGRVRGGSSAASGERRSASQSQHLPSAPTAGATQAPSVDYFPTALLALALTASTWHVGRTVVAGAAKRGARSSSARRGLAAADTAQARGGRAPSRPERGAATAAPKHGSQPASQRAESTTAATAQTQQRPQPASACQRPTQEPQAQDELTSHVQQRHTRSREPSPEPQRATAPAMRRNRHARPANAHAAPPPAPAQPSNAVAAAGSPQLKDYAPLVAGNPCTNTSAAAAGSSCSTEGDGSSCLVCLDRPWQHGFLHGGSVHIGVCGECLAALQAAERGRGVELSCPVCRGRVERTVALFA